MARILLVDDEEYIRRLFTEELSEEGHEGSSLASGHELLRKIDFFQPEAVILNFTQATRLFSSNTGKPRKILDQATLTTAFLVLLSGSYYS